MSASLHVESTGDGAPLVLLHGWAMHSGFWGPLIPRLAGRHRVHAVDLPGHGYSPPMTAFNLDGAAEILAASFATVGQPLTVLGWSLGGLVAMRWALRDRSRVGRIVLVATTPRFITSGDWPHAMSAETLARFSDELHLGWKLTIQRFLALQVQGSEHGRAILASMRNQVFARGQPSPKALCGPLAAIRDTDLRAELGGIAQPSLVISGSRDTLAHPEGGRWLADHLPNSRFVLIEGAAHTPFLSHADAFCAALDPFLDGR